MAVAALALVASACAHTPVDGGPGCAVAVGRNGETVESRGYGMASLEYAIPITPGTIFEAGSVAKQFTAASLVMLEQQGKISLDDSVRKYVPELPEVTAGVTLRHMLNHTSGLRDWGVVAEIGGWPRGARLHTMRQVVDIVARQTALNSPPGAQYSYSNSGYNLAAIVAERVSGRSLPQLTREMFFEPLGMTNSSWRDDYTRVVRNRATAYSKGRDGAYRVDMHPENIYGNCCLMTTVGDLTKWNAHLDRGGPFAAAMERQGVLTSGAGINYAHGLRVGTWAGTREVAHSGSTGGYRSYLARYPEKKLSVAVLCNDGSAAPTTVARNLAKKYVSGGQAILPVPPLPPQGQAGLPVLHSGLYRDEGTDAVLQIFQKEGTLRLGFTSGPELRHIGGNVYRAGDTELSVDGDVITQTYSNRKAMYRRVAAFSPSPQQLVEYAGEYRSHEADVTYRVVLSGSVLSVELPSKAAQPLLPTFADAFRLDDSTLIRFTRDSSGRVDGLDLKGSFDMTSGVARVERLHFTEIR